MQKPITKVAGVTFDNDLEDGGESRQTLLQEIFNNGKPILVKLDYCQFEGEDAIKVRVKKTGKVIGWIPKTHIQTVTEQKLTQMVLFTAFYKGKYSGVLYKSEEPTGKQYGFIKKNCPNKPEYDRLIYGYEIARMK